MAAERQVPDVLLERFLADDLGSEMRRHIEAERDARPEVRARLDELAAGREKFLAADPPADFARRLAGRLEMEQQSEVAAAAAPARPRRWIAWVLGPSAAAIAAAALVVTFTVTRSPDETASIVLDAPEASLEPAARTTASPTPAPAPVEEAAPESRVAPKRHPLRASGKRAKMKSRKRKKESARPTKVTGGATRKPPPPPKPSTMPPPPEPAPEPEMVEDVAAGEAAPAPVAPAAAASSDEPLFDDGQLSRKQIMAVLAKRARELQRCMKASQDVAPGEYRLVLAWTVKPNGSVDEARLESPTALRQTTLSRCLLKRVRAWKFPRAERPTPVSIPVRGTVK